MKEIVIILLTQTFTLLTLWLKEYYIKKKLTEKTLSPIDRSELYMTLTRICGEIKRDLGANGVYIAYFHNGDFYKNGMCIDKFTVVAEDYDEQINKSYISKYQSMTINYINYLYHRLLTDSRCYKENIPDLKMIDTTYKNDCLERGIYSTYSFLLKDHDEKPIGFISVEYINSVYFTKDKESYIWKHQLSTARTINKYKKNG